jgi:alpha-D-ribose 1-methylphosphonate 5-triphosphate synthase subunit PhnG
MDDTNASPTHAARQGWMRVLALADSAELDQAFAGLGRQAGPLPAHQWLRKPETGMAMVRARTGGTGEQFNLGEITVTRCALTLDDGTMGVAYVRGRSQRHAEQAALADALLQTEAWRERVLGQLIEPLAHAHAERRDLQARTAAQSKVDFFTLVRGEN